MSSGYTEAERLALLWKKQYAVEEKKVEKNRNFTQRNQRERERSEPRRSNDQKHQSNANEEVDEFGRVRPNSRISNNMNSQRTERSQRSRSRSGSDRYTRRSRSRSKEKFRNSNPARERSRSGSRGRRRSQSRSRKNREREGRKVEDSWGHDLFDDKIEENEKGNQKRSLPSDYRPPSPEWISRAGGVAIMRKKTTKDDQR
eukprot:gene7405-7988_t